MSAARKSEKGGGKGKVRFTLELQARTNDELVELARASGISKSAMLHSAVKLLIVIAEAKERGQELALVGEDGEVMKIFLV